MVVHELGLHTQFVGEIKDVKVNDGLLGDDGRVDLGRLRPILFVPDRQAYHAIGAFVGKAFSLGKSLAGRS
jgi:flavin reductase (DIM6/NTAB) family NADH-FMN oxidoreductase RutF